MKIKSIEKYSHFIIEMEDGKIYKYVPDQSKQTHWGEWFLDFDGHYVKVLNEEKINQLKDAYIEHVDYIVSFGAYE